VIRREASPLALPFLDADIWTLRLPLGISPDRANPLVREWVEHFYENEWIHHARQGLDGLSPLAAAHHADRGDLVLRAKLDAVVGFREQLGNRPSAVQLYQGYPFDRLRRRLGMAPVDSATVDRADLLCAGPDELDRLDPAVLDDHGLDDATISAAGLRDDARTVLLAAELFRRWPRQLVSLDVSEVVAALVRQAMKVHDCDAALGWIDQGRSIGNPQTAAVLDIWRAEVLSLAGRADAALCFYRRLIQPNAAGGALALDAAETLLGNGQIEQGRRLLDLAIELARSTSRRWIERRAQQLLDGL
jgi:hypothetical protein